MSITRVGSATGSTSATLPAFTDGDLALVFAFRDGSVTAPTTPAGWTVLNTVGANTCSHTLAYRMLQTGDTTTGTWTNASGVVVHVYRSSLGVYRARAGGHNTPGAINTSVAYSGIATDGTLSTTSRAMLHQTGTSWVAGFAGHRSVDTALETAPAGMTNVSTRVDATAEVAGHDTNGGTASFTGASVSAGGTSSGYRTATVETVETVFGGPVQVLASDNVADNAAVAMPSPVRSGNLLVVFDGTDDSTATLVTDTQGNTYTQVDQQYNAVIDRQLSILWAIMGTSGANSVLVDTPAGATTRLSVKAEFQGPFAIAPGDQATSATGNSTSANSGNITPTVNGALVVGWLLAGGTITSTGSSLPYQIERASRTLTGSDAAILAPVQTTAAAIAATAVIGTAPNAIWIAEIASFKPVVEVAKTLRQKRAIASPYTSGTAYSFMNDVRQGSLLVLSFGHASSHTPTISDSQGNTWASARSHFEASFGYRTDIYYTIAGSSGPNAVTITEPNSPGPAVLAEYTGPWHTAPLDQVNSAGGSSASPSSGNITPTVNGAMLFGYIDGSNITGAGTGWTADDISPAPPAGATCIESLIQTTAATDAADCTVSSSVLWVASVVSFKGPTTTTETTGSAAGLATIAAIAAKIWRTLASAAGSGSLTSAAVAIGSRSATTAGAGAASAVGRWFSLTAANSSGTGAATAAATRILPIGAASAGAATVIGAAASLIPPSVGSTSGASTAAASSALFQAIPAAAAGAGAASGQTQVIRAATAQAGGTAGGIVTAAATVERTGASAGTGTVTGQTVSLRTGATSAEGSATLVGLAATLTSALGASAGLADLDGIASALIDTAGSADGFGTGAGLASAVTGTAVTAAGAGSGLAVAEDAQESAGVATAAGLTTAVMVAASILPVAASAAGTTTATTESAAIGATAGAASGTASLSADSDPTREATAASVGTAAVTASGGYLLAGAATAAGVATLAAESDAINSLAGTATAAGSGAAAGAGDFRARIAVTATTTGAGTLAASSGATSGRTVAAAGLGLSSAQSASVAVAARNGLAAGLAAVTASPSAIAGSVAATAGGSVVAAISTDVAPTEAAATATGSSTVAANSVTVVPGTGSTAGSAEAAAESGPAGMIQQQTPLLAIRAAVLAQLANDERLTDLLYGGTSAVTRAATGPARVTYRTRHAAVLLEPSGTFFDFGIWDSVLPVTRRTLHVDVWDTDLNRAEIIAHRIRTLLDFRKAESAGLPPAQIPLGGPARIDYLGVDVMNPSDLMPESEEGDVDRQGLEFRLIATRLP